MRLFAGSATRVTRIRTQILTRRAQQTMFFGIIKMICIMNVFGSSIRCGVSVHACALTPCVGFLPRIAHDTSAHDAHMRRLRDPRRACARTRHTSAVAVCSRSVCVRVVTENLHARTQTHATPKNQQKTRTVSARRYSSKLPNKSCYTAWNLGSDGAHAVALSAFGLGGGLV